jgi:hypothetical protein
MRYSKSLYQLTASEQSVGLVGVVDNNNYSCLVGAFTYQLCKLALMFIMRIISFDTILVEGCQCHQYAEGDLWKAININK